MHEHRGELRYRVFLRTTRCHEQVSEYFDVELAVAHLHGMLDALHSGAQASR
jgi:hypothetical protein